MASFLTRFNHKMAFKLILYLPLLISFVTSQQTQIPPLKTIQIKDGDIIDCIDIHKQPAFNHPALKNHTIQMNASHLGTRRNGRKAPSQVWQKYGSCPDGTIPMRRPSTDHPPNNHPGIGNVITYPNRSFSVVLTQGLSYSGATGDIKVWNPFVESNTDYSSSQVMLRNGPLQTFDTAEAGWAVNPVVYNDTKTRFFAYWTTDGMQKTGCFDLTCPGFVQTSKDILLGGDISNLYGYTISIRISKDPYTLNWWLLYNGEEVGYWPGEIFWVLKHEANLVQWGGAVFSPKIGTQPHTATGMGNGNFADLIFGRSGVIKRILIEENSHDLKPPETLWPMSDEWDCYNAYLQRYYVREPIFLYGGPGSRQNPRCP